MIKLLREFDYKLLEVLLISQDEIWTLVGPVSMCYTGNEICYLATLKRDTDEETI